MALDQVSLFFYPPRWQQQLRPDSAMLPEDGGPVQLAYSVPREDVASPPVPVGELTGWLAGQGFVPTEWGQGRVLTRGRLQSAIGTKHEVVVQVSEEAGEVTYLYCRFGLSPRGLTAAPGWAEFVASLCGRFGLRLGADGVGPCGAVEFLTTLRASPNYRRFAESFGWDAPES